MLDMQTGWISRGDVPQSPIDPLQRRRELIDHYERNSHPERAAYLRRMDDGQSVLAGLQAATTEPALMLEAVLGALEWWAGPDIGRFAITDVMVSGDDIVHFGFRLEHVLLSGLAARVNTRLQPLPRQLRLSPDFEVYRLVRTWHEAINGLGPLPQLTLSPPHRDGVTSMHVTVCELCSVVDLTVKPSSRCLLCAKRHRMPGAVLAPITHPELPWLITGYRQKYFRTCAVCGGVFFGNADAESCSPRCRTARHRAARGAG
jgi:hypothetical protein